MSKKMDQQQTIIKPNKEAIVDHYLVKGYHILFKDETYVQLIKEKKFSCLVSGLLLLFLVPFLPLYLVYYLSNRDKKINIRVLSENTVGIITGKGKETVFDHMPTSKELNKATLTKSDIFWRWALIIWGVLSFILNVVILGYVISSI